MTANTRLGANGSGGQVTLKSLGQDAASELTVSPVQATLNGTLPLSVTGVNLGISQTPELLLSTSNNLTTVAVTPNPALQTLLNGFSSLTPGDVAQSLQNMVTLLQDPTQGAPALLGALNTPLPLLGESLNDILGLSSALSTAASALSQADSLAALQAAVQDILQTVVSGTLAPAVNSSGYIALPGTATTATATFTVVDDGQQSQPVAVTIGNTTTPAEFVQDINNAMVAAGVSSAVMAGQNGQGDITFTDTNGNPLQLTTISGDSVISELLPSQAGLSLRSAIVGLPANVANTALIDVAEDLTARRRIARPWRASRHRSSPPPGPERRHQRDQRQPAVSRGQHVCTQCGPRGIAKRHALRANLSVRRQFRSLVRAQLRPRREGNGQFCPRSATMGTDQAIVIDLALDPSFSKSVSLGSLALTGLGPLTFSGGGGVTVTVGGTANLDFGYDLTTSAPFLVGATGLALTAQIASTGLTLRGDIGSIGVSIGSSGNPATISLTDGNSAASVSVTTADPTAWIPFSQISVGTFEFGSGGLLSANLPIYVGSASLGSISLSFNLGTLASNDHAPQRPVGKSGPGQFRFFAAFRRHQRLPDRPGNDHRGRIGEFAADRQNLWWLQSR